MLTLIFSFSVSVPLRTQSSKFSGFSFGSKSLCDPHNKDKIENLVTVEMGLTEINVGVSPWMSQASERQSSSERQSRTETEAGVQTQSEM